MTMEREACPSCGEPVALDARVCPHCEHSVLVDLWLEAPITDGRLRYQIARSLQAAGPPIPAFPGLQAALASDRPIVVRGASRAFARRVQETLQAPHVDSVVRGASGGAGTGGFPLARVLTIAAAVGVVLGAVLWLARRPATPKTAVSGPQAPTVVPRPSATAALLSTRELARRVLPSTVSLRCSKSVGAGFFVTDELLLTNAHVLCGSGERITVIFSDGKKLPGDVVRRDDSLDLAMVRVEGARIQPLPLGDAGGLSVGDKVVLVGSPVALEFSLSEGIVSNLSRPFLGVSYLQINAGVNPGNSGGPLFDQRGQVVGITSLKHIQAEGIGLVLPINYAYSGNPPFVQAPDENRRSPGFEQMVAAAEAQNQEASRELSSMKLLPGLVGGKVDEYRRLVVHVIRPARSMPADEEITVRVVSNGEVVCNLKGDIREWKHLEGRQPLSQMDDRSKAWLEKVGFDIYLYLGESPLRIDLCPWDRMRNNLVLELEGADPQAARLAIR